MKATTEMSYRLIKSAKAVAQRSKATQLALTEEDSTRVINEPQAKAKSAFKLEKASVGGKPFLKSTPADWQRLEEQHVSDRVLTQKARR
jgi:hypothetical protein